MFTIKENDHVYLTEDCQFGRAGTDLGLLADVIVNHIAAIDPEAPADSLVYRVARACHDGHKAHCEAMEAEHQRNLEAVSAKVAAVTAELNRFKNPQPDDDEAIEAAARKRAQELLTHEKIEARAKALLAGE